MTEQADEGAGREQPGEVEDEAIRRRAYEIAQSEDAGTDEENWRRAEEELRRGSQTPSS